MRIVGYVFLSIGLLVFILEVIGVFHQKKALNRMHAAGMGDTLGLLSSMIGLMIISGWNLNTAKMGFVVIILWFTSPVATHLLSKMEVTTDPELETYCEVEKDENI